MFEMATLYESDGLAVLDYRCDGTPAGQDDEEVANEHLVVVPRAGTFVKHDSSSRFVSDVNHAVFFHRDRPFRVSHPVPGGDLCTIFAPAPALRLELMRWHGPPEDADEEAPLPIDWVPLGGPSYLAQRLVFDRLYAGGDVSPLEIEEWALLFLGEAVNAAYTAMRNSSGHTSRGRRSEAPEIAHQAQLTLAEWTTRKVTLTEVASSVHCSPYYLSRIFKAEAGISLHRYLSRLRLRASLEWLSSHPKERFADAAIEHGFSSHSHFSSAFRREFGVSPSELRPGCPEALRTLSKIRIA